MAKKLGEKRIDNFIKLAEAINIKFSKGALIGVEKFLDSDYWLSYCEDTLSFYYNFHNILRSTARYLLVNYDTHRPEILDFLIANENKLAKKFPPIKTEGATYSHTIIALEYILSQVLLRILSDNRDVFANEKLVPKVFQALWNSYKADPYADPDNKERWQSYEVLLKLIYGKYAEVIQEYDELFKYDLAKYENSRRTLIKECYALAKIATNDYDSDLLFGARTYISLLKYQFYLWLVKEELSAKIDLIPVLIIVYLHKVIVDKSPGNPLEIFFLMKPGNVLEELTAMEKGEIKG